MSYIVRVKICGITNQDDLECSLASGADAIGFNFHKASPRYISFNEYHGLTKHLPVKTESVGVFVDKTLKEIKETLSPISGITTIQSHSEFLEIPIDLEYNFIPAFSLKSNHQFKSILDYLNYCKTMAAYPSAVLLDGYSPILRGGSGKIAPWNTIASINWPIPVILAGGLCPENVAEAIRIVRPWAVDVASGVEVHPGKKDHYKLGQFIHNAKQAALSLPK